MILTGLKIKVSVLAVLLSLIFTHSVLAEAPKLLKTQYRDKYTITQTRNLLVQKQIEFTNLRDDLYVSQYQLSFHNPHPIINLQVLEDGKRGVFNKVDQSNQTIITVELQNPVIGINQTKSLLLQYEWADYINEYSRYTGLLLPLSRVSDNETLVDYEVKLVVSQNFNALGISKPRVKTLDSNTFVWPQAQTFDVKALYVSFADKASYQVDFAYYLFNATQHERIMAATLIPDGTFQKAYLNQLEPKPEQVELDSEGNLLAYYRVKAKQTLRVNYSGVVELFTKPRAEMGLYQQSFLANLKTRYLTQERYWSLKPEIIKETAKSNLNTGKAIYDYVVNRLEYSHDRLNNNPRREGAQWAWLNPKQAVCMEYTDLFIALSREKGVPSREVVGYGITNDDQLQPLSFLGDVLHAWPEYFDPARQLWLGIDPTWEDTSGLDYFTSLDLNHIAFVYHGKDSDLPLPPGVYKQNPQDREIMVKPIAQPPLSRTQWQVTWPKTLVLSSKHREAYTTKLKAQANTINYRVRLELRDKSTGKIIFNQTLAAVPPLSTQNLDWTWPVNKLPPGRNRVLQLLVNGVVVSQKPYSVVSPVGSWFLDPWLWLLFLSPVVGYLFLKKWRH